MLQIYWAVKAIEKCFDQLKHPQATQLGFWSQPCNQSPFLSGLCVLHIKYAQNVLFFYELKSSLVFQIYEKKTLSF